MDVVSTWPFRLAEKLIRVYMANQFGSLNVLLLVCLKASKVVSPSIGDGSLPVYSSITNVMEMGQQAPFHWFPI